MPSRTNAVSIDAIIADSRCQSRTGIDLALVQEYADSIKEGAALPPLSTIHAKEGYYLYDGFHRIEAYRQAGVKNVVIETEPGDVWDAIERSCAVNAAHGKRRTNADKHRAVETMLKVMAHKGENWSSREIARRCGVSPDLVDRVRPSLPESGSDTPRTYTDRYGNTATMNTANIGKRPVPTLDPGPEDVDADTGEIEDDYPPFEVVAPDSPEAMYTPIRPVAPPAPRVERQTIEFTTAQSLAAAIRARCDGDFIATLIAELRP